MAEQTERIDVGMIYDYARVVATDFKPGMVISETGLIVVRGNFAGDPADTFDVWVNRKKVASLRGINAELVEVVSFNRKAFGNWWPLLQAALTEKYQTKH